MFLQERGCDVPVLLELDQTDPTTPTEKQGVLKLRLQFEVIDAAKSSKLEVYFGADDMVVLSGAHSVSRAHYCSSHFDRRTGPTSTRRFWRRWSDSARRVMAAAITRWQQDGQHMYYTNVLFIDHVPDEKFKAAAMVRMGAVDVKTATDGEIRKQFRFVLLLYCRES
ncbi:hypothetical protein PR202_gb21814 [Eleusine coracana subsp. coracana]|uniref:Plant heme peroxidase family profile domain-containing protein n=1 Tax=Eleusine coracana subsp. coracana TaxID=191504 RepID=A0AAV5FE53_ELECO|nr:hypothetical protein PR202_gb21814 [Eleusine coracana subsp. coracana]